jgi:hypothetical protein
VTYPAEYAQKREMRRLLYALKRRYGGSIVVYKLLDSQTDPRTGRKTVSVKEAQVPRAVVMPARSARKAVRGISLTSANKEMVAGGTYDSSTRDFIIERADLLGITTLTADDWLVYNGRKYQVAAVDEVEFDSYWCVTAKESVGETPKQSIRVQAANDLSLFSAVEGA